MYKCIMFCVLCAALFRCATLSSASTCMGRGAGSDVKLPPEKYIMSLDDFDVHVENTRFGEFYFVTPNPAPFDPYVNYYITFMKEAEGQYVETYFGETFGNNPQCVFGNSTRYKSNVYDDKAAFFNVTIGTYTVFWSSCPSSYVIMFRCTSSAKLYKRCPQKNSFFLILVPGYPDDLPMTSIVQDMCRDIGVKFGSEDFRWFFTYGEAKICVSQGIP